MSRRNLLGWLFAFGLVLGVGFLHSDTSLIVPVDTFLAVFTLFFGWLYYRARRHNQPKAQDLIGNVMAYNLGLIAASIIVLAITH